MPGGNPPEAKAPPRDMGRGRPPHPHLGNVLRKLQAIMDRGLSGYGRTPLCDAVDPLSEREPSPEEPGYVFWGRCAIARSLYRALVREHPFPAGSPAPRKISQLWGQEGWRTTLAYRLPAKMKGKEGVHRLDVHELTILVWHNQDGLCAHPHCKSGDGGTRRRFPKPEKGVKDPLRHFHHIIERSAVRGKTWGPNEPWNVIMICIPCHMAEHDMAKKGKWVLGDAGTVAFARRLPGE